MQADAIRSKLQRNPLLVAAATLLLAKLLLFWLDHHPLFFDDSPGYLANAVNFPASAHWPGFSRPDPIAFGPASATRSFVYSILLRFLADTFHSFTVVVATQMLMGFVSAWMLFVSLFRLLGVRFRIALLAALLFAFDPVQLLDEHLVLTEACAMCSTAIGLTFALAYVRSKNLLWLVAISAVAVLQVSMRFVYIPVVHVAAVLLPLVVYFRFRVREIEWKPLMLALGVSIFSTLLFQSGYRHFIGRMLQREPAYYYQSGQFLIGNLSPIVRPEDSSDPRIAAAIEAQWNGTWPPRAEQRSFQLWSPGGLIHKMDAIPLDFTYRDTMERKAAIHAVMRNPLALLRLGFRTYGGYWMALPQYRKLADVDNYQPETLLTNPYNDANITAHFHLDMEAVRNDWTFSRRYVVALSYWIVVLLLGWPFVTGLPLFFRSVLSRGTAWLFIWTGLLMSATCLGGESMLRYLHPFSWPVLMAIALLGEGFLRSRPSRQFVERASSAQTLSSNGL